MLRATMACTFSTSQLPKVLRSCYALYILTSECGSRHNGEQKSQRRESQKKAPKGREIAKHSVFPMVCGSGASKSRLAKAAGAEPSGQMRDEKLHAVVARSTFGSQNVQITPFSDHFWKLRCRKSARRPLIFSVLTLSSDSFSSLSR